MVKKKKSVLHHHACFNCVRHLGEIQQLMELEGPEDYVCSLKWIKEANVLAVGNTTGEISLWDVEQLKKIRTMTGHTDRVGSLSWNEVSTKFFKVSTKFFRGGAPSYSALVRCNWGKIVKMGASEASH